MNLINGIKNNLSQIFAIAEKNVRLLSRYKLRLILGFFTPILSIILPLIVMGEIFNLNRGESFGPWDGRNFIVFQFTSYMLILLYQIVGRFQQGIAQEKGLNTLTLLIIAPFRRINLLFGIFLSHLILISIPFLSFFIWAYILFPVSIITLFFIFLVYLLIALFFSGIGLVFAIFVVSKEHLVSLFKIPLNIFLMFSCLSMPFEFFPEYFQNIANLNPFYHIFNIVRQIWMENNIIISVTSHTLTFIVVISFAILSPLFGLRFFNYIFDKYGIYIY